MVVPTPRLRVTLRNVVNRCKSRTEMEEINEICFNALDPGISIYVYDGTAKNKRNLCHHRV